MKKIKLGILGYGRMGHAVEEELKLGDYGLELAWTLDAGTSNTDLRKALKNAGVVIEFTRPEAAVANISAAIESGVPVVSGTTGWYGHLEVVRKVCEQHQGAVLYSPNFSIGVNLFFVLSAYAAKLMAPHQRYKTRIVETHHTAKLDAPSGTAIRLAEEVLRELPQYRSWVNASETLPGQLPVISLRKPEVPGTHEILFESPEDLLRLEHVALSRAGFARGALQAAQWLPGKKGVLTMQDMLSLPMNC